MKLRRKKYFLEFGALLLQRTMEEGSSNLVLDWGNSILQVLSRFALLTFKSSHIFVQDKMTSFHFTFICLNFYASITRCIEPLIL